MALSCSRFKIKYRLLVLIGLVTVGMGALVFISLQALSDSLFKQRIEQTQQQVEAISSLASLQKKNLSEEEKQALLREIKAIRYSGKEYFWVHHLNGTMLMHPTQPQLDQTQVFGMKDADGKFLFKEMADLVSAKGAGTHIYYWPPGEKAQKKISYVKLIPELGWIIGTGVFVQDIDDRVNAVGKQIALAILGVMTLVISVALFIGRTISGSISQLNTSMRSLASGNLDIEIGMAHCRDEVGEMAQTVRVFQEHAREVERLKKQQAEMEAKTQREKKETMAKLANDFEKGVGDIMSTVTTSAMDLKSFAKNLSEMSDQTSRQTSTVAAATEEASASVQTVASASEELSASIGEINRQIEESSRVAAKAVEEVKRTDATVSTLSEAATQIGDVIKLIQDIAQQTNLLALNATIEAARAGEAGKGFAVVANEVKNLATQTGRATEEIAKKIETVQSVSGEAVGALRNIGGVIERIDSITRVIAEALGQQEDATREISNNVQQASAGISEVSSSIVNVSHAAKESATAAEDVLGSANALSQKSDELRNQIAIFLQTVRGT